jgi:hypothetical protein
MAGQAPHGAAALACWNWALTGFNPVQNNPDELFNFVSYNLPYNTGGAIAWYNVVANQTALATLQGQWAPFDGGPASANALQALQQVCEAITRLACSLNGLTPVVGNSPYEVVMHYDSTDRHGNLNGPNYTHWWLRIDGGGANFHNDGLEVFPGNANLNIRRPEYANNNNCRVFVQELHQDHVTRIDNVVNAVIRANHTAGVIAHAAWNDTSTCAVCGSTVIPGFTRHHCRCCGRTVCASCSPTSRPALWDGRAAVAKPGNAAGAGPYRVCIYC